MQVLVTPFHPPDSFSIARRSSEGDGQEMGGFGTFRHFLSDRRVLVLCYELIC